MKDKHALFCCSRVASFLLQSIISFSEKYHIHCHIISRPPSEDAPYIYPNKANITYHNKGALTTTTLLSMTENLNPSVVFISGWIEKDYLLVARKYRAKGISVIMCLDNHWTNTWKQNIGAFAARTLFPLLFSHIWIPGKPQKLFAQKLGFKNNQILIGYCAANVTQFRLGYTPGKVFRNILFIGRLVAYKRPLELFKIFQSLSKENKGWILTFIGNGECKKFIQESDQVRIINFLQPAELIEELKKASIFCLPSTLEHWGLVVQEACAAGKLLLTSDQVGAASEFLIPDYNGLLFKSDDLNELEQCLKRILAMTDEELLLFQKRSFELEQKNNPEVWADKLHQIIHSSEL